MLMEFERFVCVLDWIFICCYLFVVVVEESVDLSLKSVKGKLRWELSCGWDQFLFVLVIKVEVLLVDCCFIIRCYFVQDV